MNTSFFLSRAAFAKVQAALLFSGVLARTKTNMVSKTLDVHLPGTKRHVGLLLEPSCLCSQQTGAKKTTDAELNCRYARIVRFEASECSYCTGKLNLLRKRRDWRCLASMATGPRPHSRRKRHLADQFCLWIIKCAAILGPLTV